MWAAFRAAFFVGSPEWAWRRRLTITAAATMLTGIIHSIFFEHDLAKATMVMGHCQTGLATILGLYIGGAVVDDKFRRDRTNQEKGSGA